MPNPFSSLFSQSSVPTLNLPPDPSCGKCSGVRQYNSQIPENNTCDFSGSQPFGPPSGSIFNQPGYDGPPPVSPFSWGKPNGSTVPPQVGQWEPSYFQPTTQIPPSYPQPGDNPGGNPFRPPCPRVDNRPTPKFGPQPYVPPSKPPSGPDNNPCSPCGGNNYTWDNRGSQRQPLITMCGSGNMPCPPNPFPTIWHQPTYVPPILQSGKRRSSTTPDDVCQPQ